MSKKWCFEESRRDPKKYPDEKMTLGMETEIRIRIRIRIGIGLGIRSDTLNRTLEGLMNMKTMAKTVSMIVLYLTMNVLVVQHAAAATTPSRWATACLKALRFKPPGISFEKQLDSI